MVPLVRQQPQSWYPGKIFYISSDERRVIDHRGGRNQQIHCGDRPSGSLDGREDAAMSCRESTIRISNQQSAQEVVELLVLFQRALRELSTRPQFANDVNGSRQRLSGVESFDELQRGPGPASSRFPQEVDQIRSVEMDHRFAARAGLALRSRT